MRIRLLLFCLLLSLFFSINIYAQNYEFFSALEGVPAAKAKAIELKLNDSKLIFIGAFDTFFGEPQYNVQSCWQGKAQNWFYIFSYNNDTNLVLISITKGFNIFVAFVPFDLNVGSFLIDNFGYYFKSCEPLPDSLKDSDTKFYLHEIKDSTRTILPDSCMFRIGIGAKENFPGLDKYFDDKFIWFVSERYWIDNGFGGKQEEGGEIVISALTGNYLMGWFTVNVEDYKIEESDIIIKPNPVTDYINISKSIKQSIYLIRGNFLLPQFQF